MFSPEVNLLKTRPTILPSATAGPPLLPGFSAASIWIRSPRAW